MPPRSFVLSSLCLTALASAQVQEGKLEPSGAPTFANFGSSISSDADVVVVGAPWTRINGLNYAGAAHIYRKSGTTWSEEVRLTRPSPEIHDNFGAGVAIHGDVAVVGAPDLPVSSFTGRGAVYVYRRVTGTWTEEAHLIGSDAGVDSAFGRAVAFDGQTILVSSYRLGNEKVYVFERVGTTWTQVASFAAPQPFVRFGFDMQVRGDTALVGAEWQTVNGKTHAGAVHVLRRTGGVWGVEAVLTDPAPEDQTRLGSSVGFDGTRAVLGAPGDVVRGVDTGSVSLFVRSGTTWTFERRLDSPVPQRGAAFGTGVGIAGDLVVVSAPRQDFPDAGIGVVFPFRWNGSTWVSEAPFLPADASVDSAFGETTALDGLRGIFSAWDPTAEGVAYVYDMADTTGGFSLAPAPVPVEVEQDLTLTLRGGQPNAVTGLLYSLVGRGSLPFPPLQVIIGLDSPDVLVALATDGAGGATLDFPVPASVAGASLWLQALQFGAVSNVTMLHFILPN
ncbi:MAG: hypothetical protein R3F56_25235 [Planctomycetota bacterium]